jgi:hypothetical protein
MLKTILDDQFQGGNQDLFFDDVDLPLRASESGHVKKFHLAVGVQKKTELNSKL